MIRTALLTFLLTLTCGLTQAQQLDPEIYSDRSWRKNRIYGELIGSTFGLGINYERTLVTDSSIELNARIGVGSIIFVSAVPLIGVNMLVGKNKNRFEIGVNGIRTYAFGIMGGEATYFFVNPVLGYRYQGNDGLIFRFTFSPMVEAYDPDNWVSNDRPFLPLAGISLGFSF